MTRRKTATDEPKVEQAEDVEAAAAAKELAEDERVTEEVAENVSRETLPFVSAAAIARARRQDPFRRAGYGHDLTREPVLRVTEALVKAGYLTYPSETLGWNEQARLDSYLNDSGETLAQMGDRFGFEVTE